MKIFLKICKWLGISALVGCVSFLISVGCLAKNNDKTFGEQFKDTLSIEQTVETPEDKEDEDVVVTPEVEDENKDDNTAE